MAFELPNNDIELSEEIDDQLDELAYEEAERIVALFKKKGQCWPIERLIADSLRHCYQELYVLRGNKRQS